MEFSRRLLPHQLEFLSSNEQFVALVGGIGLGKSETLRYYLLKRAYETDPRDLILLAANTDAQLRNVVLNPLFAFLDDLNISYRMNRNTGILKIGPASILCASLENYNPLRGIEVSTVIIDEGAFSKGDALDIVLGRLRSKYTKDLHFRVFTSPNGYNEFYQLFAGERKLPNAKVISGKTKDNIFLPKAYVQSLYQSYTPKQIMQELEGRFVSLTSGAMYYPFDMDRHVVQNIRYHPDQPIYVGMDFNVGLHCSVLMQIINDRIHVFDEICLADTNTYDAAQKIKAKYGRTSLPITICPDATGARRQTSAENSDHEILRRAGFLVHTDKSNPRVEDRINTVNLAFQNDQIVVSPTCHTLIKDLNLMTHTTKNKDPMLSHASDAFGYAVYKINPIVMRQKASSTIILD
jgi:PBSX family phage terminase large subunit